MLGNTQLYMHTETRHNRPVDRNQGEAKSWASSVARHMYTARETGRDEERQDAEIAEQGKEQANSTQDSLCVDCSENEPSVCQLCPDEAEGIQCTTCISDDKAAAQSAKTALWFMRSEWQKFNAGAGIGKRLLHLCVRSRTSGERAKGQNHHYGDS